VYLASGFMNCLELHPHARAGTIWIRKWRITNRLGDAVLKSVLIAGPLKTSVTIPETLYSLQEKILRFLLESTTHSRTGSCGGDFVEV
jgi:hypothetical protein